MIFPEVTVRWILLCDNRLILGFALSEGTLRLDQVWMSHRLDAGDG